jgi:hypothetical protein
MEKTQTKWLALGLVLFSACLLQPFLVTKQSNTSWYFPITLATLSSFGLAMGITYDWRKRTSSWIYKGSLLLVLIPLLAGVITYLWFVVLFARNFRF